MLSRLVEIFCEVDDFCKRCDGDMAHTLISQGDAPRGPEPKLCESEIMTILIVLHSCSGYKCLKTFYNGLYGDALRQYFPGMPCYERFVELQKRATIFLAAFSFSRSGRRTGIYYVDSTPLPVCHNKRIGRHKTFDAVAQRGKTSIGWFFGLKLHLVFNHLHEIVAFRLTPGNVADTTPVEPLTSGLKGKLFGDKGYIGKKLVETLMRRGLTLMTRVRKNMKTLPISQQDKMLLNKRNMAETIIGHIKAFSALNLPRHRSVLNAFLHILAALVAYQINPILPKSKLQIS